MSDTNEQQIYEEMLNEIGAGATASGDVAQQAFTSFFCDFLVEKAHFVPELVPCYFNKIYKNARARVDAYYLDEQTHDLTLVVSDFVRDRTVVNIGLTDIKDIFKQARRFFAVAPTSDFRHGVEDTDEVVALANLIFDNTHLIKRVRYILVTNRQLGNHVKSSEFADLKQQSTIASEYTVWDFRRYSEMVSSLNPPSEIEVDCCLHSEGEKGLPFLTVPSAGLRHDPASPDKKVREYEAYLLMVPGQCIYDWYAQYSDRLLEQNVRTFLQFKGKVNRGIRQTIMTEPSRFLAYNNGLTATAEEVTFDKSGKLITGIKNLQIVNGGQTTASIYTAFNAKEAELESIAVQMKLIVVPQGNVDDMVAKISRYANSQNKIKDTDLASNQRFMLRMESFSRTVTANPGGTLRGIRWFFERTRGQYANSINVLPTESARNKFKALYPKDHVFTKPDLAKYILAWDWVPWMAARGGEKAFVYFEKGHFGSPEGTPGLELVEGWKFSDPDSNPQFSEFYYKELIGKVMLHLFLDKALRKCSWCLSYKTKIADYTLAVFHKIVYSNKLAFDFDFIWANQSVPQVLVEYMISLAASVNEQLQSSAHGRDIGEIAKSEEFWQKLRVKYMGDVLPDEIKKFCRPQSVIAKKREDAIAVQKKRNGSELLLLLASTEDAVFKELRGWISSHKFAASLAQLDALNTRISRPSSMIGTDAIKLMKLWQQAAKGGFLFAPPEE